MRKVLKQTLKHCDKGQILTKADCDRVFGNIKIEDDEFTKETFIPGSSGISALYRRLISESGIEE